MKGIVFEFVSLCIIVHMNKQKISYYQAGSNKAGKAYELF